ncbi:helix-turn-helix domain-containing protein [Caloranaerobacter ferrireducens]
MKEIRKVKGLTIRQLAEKAELSIGYLSELETGIGGKTNPSIKVL